MATTSSGNTRSHTTVASAPVIDNHEAHYQGLLRGVRSKFQTLDRMPTNIALFTVDTDGLYDVYLNSLPADQRQHHTCNACRSFFKNYAGLVYITALNEVKSLLWDGNSCAGIYRPAASALRYAVEGRPVKGVFVSKERTLGTPKTGFWNHFAVDLQANRVFRERVLTPYQFSAAKLESFNNLQRALQEFKLETLLKISSLIVSGKLTRPELIKDLLATLTNLKRELTATHSAKANNFYWRQVAILPESVCAPRSSVLGGLIEDLQSGMKEDEAIRRYNEKVDPMFYRRATTVRAGNVAAAESAFEKLGAYPALERRYARADEVNYLWRNNHIAVAVASAPKSKSATASGSTPFSGLVAGGKKAALPMKALSNTPRKMTFARFQAEVLPEAVSISYTPRRRRELFQALTTAVNKDAIPLFRWDKEDARNPVSWYQWLGGATPEQFGLSLAKTHYVTGICLKPSLWSGDEKSGFGALFLIEGAKDTRFREAGTGLFPDLLKSEFMPYRSTIDMYSRGKVLSGYEHQVTGIIVGDKEEDKDPPIFRVYTRAGYQDYQITSWY